MTARRSLRRRVAVTLAVFSAMVSLTLATFMYVASHDLERRLVDDTLTAELDDYVARRQRNPQSLPERTATIRAFVVAPQGGTAPVPPKVAALGPGSHELTLDGTPYRAAVRVVEDQRFVVLFDVSALQRREHVFLLLLAASVLLVTLASALAGRWLACIVVAPVTALARRVSAQRPEDPPRALAGEFPWQEVQQLATDFDGYLTRLHDFIERERFFTADVSHELRTPLTVVAGAAELLQADPGLDERNRSRVTRIARAVAEMREMTEALLALAREQEVRSERPLDCDVAAVAEELVQRYRNLFPDKPVELMLEIAARPRLQSDRAVLSMVLGNLLRNALAFTQEGHVRLRIESLLVAIEDTGSGLDPATGQDLFRPFVRGSDSRGAGLGLSLVQRLCAKEGWEVQLSNRQAGGTSARLRFTGSNAVDSSSGRDNRLSQASCQRLDQ
ncbi:HAMP domain-containing histidine kinase [Thiorhodococcus mannitoliphagus]|uniref:histidine kinase n=1 Tax=Thiorhodococcus mannitoliphagus TaxID=329406 RepID=A0A6P1DSX9_9GAMM|nr:HAMP domain-containing sensor histidine kinase [Thiorhodococcus mannitoliphagus]NEX19796.1 HAMP domain-containing histidine kinase [Thiorhodococcus mannitoliphagus]